MTGITLEPKRAPAPPRRGPPVGPLPFERGLLPHPAGRSGRGPAHAAPEPAPLRASAPAAGTARRLLRRPSGCAAGAARL